MNTTKIKVYSLLIALLIVTLSLFCINIEMSKVIYALIIAIIAIVCKKILLKKGREHTKVKQISLIMFGFALLYVVMGYVMGIYFGFSYSANKLSLQSLLLKIVPIVVTIISIEYIRNVIIYQPIKHINIILLIIMIFIDMYIYSGTFLITTLEGFLANFGYIFLSTITFNILYNYISKEFSYKPIVIFKIITTIYTYIIPIVPDIYQFLRTFFKIIYPYFIYLFIRKYYSRKLIKNFSELSFIKESIFSAGAYVIFAVFIICLISNRFQYGIYVIGSESMTGALNKGDCLMYERYGSQNINIGDIVIYVKEERQVIHRVVEIKEYMRTSCLCYKRGCKSN